VNDQKSGGVAGEKGECQDDAVEVIATQMKFGYFISE